MEKEKNSKFEFSFARLINLKLEGYSPEQAGVMIEKILMNRALIFMLFTIVVLFVISCFKFPEVVSFFKPFFL